MKTTIYELLGMIKDGKAPKKIMYDNGIWNYRKRTDMKDTILNVEYINEKTCCDLFDEYLITDILNDEVEILETTITMKADHSSTEATNKIEKLNLKVDTWCNPSQCDLALGKKIDELIDRVNKLL